MTNELLFSFGVIGLGALLVIALAASIGNLERLLEQFKPPT
jgi:hypothetical protein